MRGGDAVDGELNAGSDAVAAAATDIPPPAPLRAWKRTNWPPIRGAARRVTILTTLVIVGGAVILGAVIAVANAYTFPIGGAAGNGTTYTSILLLFAGLSLGTLVFAILFAIGLDDYYTGRAISPLYPPVLLLAGALAWLLALTALSALDLLVHDLEQGWYLTDEPEIRILSNGLLVALFVALAWFCAVILRGRAWTGRDLMLLFLAVAALAALGGVIPFALTR